MTKLTEKEINELYDAYNQSEMKAILLDTANGKLSINVKHRLTKYDVVHIVDYVTDGVVDKVHLGFHPENKNYCLRMAVLRAYTDIDIPDDENLRWRLAYGTPLFAMITGHENRPVKFEDRDYDDNMIIDVEQYEQVLAAIEQLIDFQVKNR